MSKDMERKEARLLNERRLFHEALQRVINDDALDVEGSTTLDDLELKVTEKKEAVSTLRKNAATLQKKCDGLQKEMDQLASIEKDFLARKQVENIRYDLAKEQIIQDHLAMVTNAGAEAAKARIVASKSFLSSFLDFFTPKFLAKWFGFNIKTNQDILNEKAEAFTKAMLSQPDFTSLKAPDFTREEGEIAHFKKNITRMMHDKQNELNHLKDTIQIKNSRLEYLENAIENIRFLEKGLSATVSNFDSISQCAKDMKTQQDSGERKADEKVSPANRRSF